MIKKILLGFLVLITAVIAYHFYAAFNAERALDESIQSVAAESDLEVTISYSSLDVNPFTGDILLSNINIIGDDLIQRSTSARFDLTYSDFLHFMIRGTEAGLRQVEEGILELRNISHTNRTTLEEFKAERIILNYRGNLWNLILLGITGRAGDVQHFVDVSGDRLTFSMPARSLGRVVADSLLWQTRFGSMPVTTDSVLSSLTLKGITWTPPENLQQRYQFFIQGFGYTTDTIPFNSLSIQYDFRPEPHLLSIPAMSLTTDLFTTRGSGMFDLAADTLDTTRIDSLVIQISDMSPRFREFIIQLQTLFGTEIPGSSGEINILINGSIDEPEIQFGS